MTIERPDLINGTEKILEILRKTDSGIEGVEVNVFYPSGAKEWRGLGQTARAGITDKTNTSAMEIPSGSLANEDELLIRAHAVKGWFHAIDKSINGLTLSIYKNSPTGSLVRHSVAVGHAWLPPEPPTKGTSDIQYIGRDLVNDPFGLGTGVAFPS